MSELAGRLTERVTLERQAGDRDALGASAGGWSAVAQGWVACVAVGAGPRVAGEAASALPRWRVTARAALPVAVGDRLVWGARRLLVTAVTRDPAAEERVTFEAEELR